ncbi:MAG TPA: hypothetical protein VMY39_10280 [Planctomycetota bacterium]|nr:hypothetical protein [Planctomycetota bacterium]HUV39992.1 hypothetical protein [Planctomycetota bacterium]
MSARALVTVICMVAALSVPLWAAQTYPDPRVPETLVEITGNRIVSYSFFAVLAGLCVLLIFRGIRAR